MLDFETKSKSQGEVTIHVRRNIKKKMVGECGEPVVSGVGWLIVERKLRW